VLLILLQKTLTLRAFSIRMFSQMHSNQISKCQISMIRNFYNGNTGISMTFSNTVLWGIFIPMVPHRRNLMFSSPKNPLFQMQQRLWKPAF
jgi:hypothetical protein